MGRFKFLSLSIRKAFLILDLVIFAIVIQWQKYTAFSFFDYQTIKCQLPIKYPVILNNGVCITPADVNFIGIANTVVLAYIIAVILDNTAKKYKVLEMVIDYFLLIATFIITILALYQIITRGNLI
ncbi:MAG: hypothetical protein AAB657_04600 [Patescibacteria group bacterium]